METDQHLVTLKWSLFMRYLGNGGPSPTQLLGAVVFSLFIISLFANSSYCCHLFFVLIKTNKILENNFLGHWGIEKSFVALQYENVISIQIGSTANFLCFSSKAVAGRTASSSAHQLESVNLKSTFSKNGSRADSFADFAVVFDNREDIPRSAAAGRTRSAQLSQSSCCCWLNCCFCVGFRECRPLNRK